MDYVRGDVFRNKIIKYRNIGFVPLVINNVTNAKLSIKKQPPTIRVDEQDHTKPKEIHETPKYSVYGPASEGGSSDMCFFHLPPRVIAETPPSSKKNTLAQKEFRRHTSERPSKRPPTEFHSSSGVKNSSI